MLEIENPFACQLVPEFSVDPVGEGSGDEGAVVGLKADCPRECPIRFKEETRQVNNSQEIESALEILRSSLAREIDFNRRCEALQEARKSGKVANYTPPPGLS